MITENTTSEVLKQNLNSNILINFINEIKISDLKKITIIEKDLKYLCDKFDPFNQEEILKSISKIIKKYHLEDLIENPFVFTNNILQLLDAVEERKKEIKKPKAIH